MNQYIYGTKYSHLYLYGINLKSFNIGIFASISTATNETAMKAINLLQTFLVTKDL